jgi:hypothetical protein
LSPAFPDLRFDAVTKNFLRPQYGNDPVISSQFAGIQPIGAAEICFYFLSDPEFTGAIE